MSLVFIAPSLVYGAEEIRLSSRSDASLNSLIEASKSLDLASDPQWRSLLHYYPNGDGVESQVDDKDFFLAVNGKTDSQAELTASIKALLFPNESSNDETDPRCVFVERSRWLRERLSIAAEPVPEWCTGYRQWRDKIQAHSLTLIFPASYLNSPSSMFGHTLFRLDPEDIAENSSWLSYSLNFAADVGADAEYSMGYAFKGIAGGYPGKFHVVPYFQKVKEYGALENRDIWEYRLNLTPTEVERILNHAWELRDINFKYYFFTQNCSFRLLELLDYARPGLDLTSQFTMTAIPSNTVKAVVESGIVADVNYRPALGTQLQYRASLIPEEQHGWIEKLTESPELANSAEFLALEQGLQQSLVSAANQNLTYQSRRTEMSEAMSAKRFKMLQILSQLPKSPSPEPPPPARPDTGHSSRMFSLGLGRSGDLNYWQAQYRMTYHDLLDNITGFIPGAEIVLGDFSIRQYEEDDLQIQSFDIIRIRSLSSRYRFFKAISWEAEVGFKRESLLEDDRLGFVTRGDAGKSWRISDANIGYSLLGVSAYLYLDNDQAAYANLHAKAGIINDNRLGTMNFELRMDVLQTHGPRWSAEIKQNVVLRKDHAIRAGIEWRQYDSESTEELQLGYRYYF